MPCHLLFMGELEGGCSSSIPPGWTVTPVSVPGAELTGLTVNVENDQLFVSSNWTHLDCYPKNPICWVNNKRKLISKYHIDLVD